MKDDADDDHILAWTVKSFATAVSLSQAYVRILVRDRIVESVKVGNRRLIRTSPQKFLDEQAKKPHGRQGES